MPDAMEMVFQAALTLGRSGAVRSLSLSLSSLYLLPPPPAFP